MSHIFARRAIAKDIAAKALGECPSIRADIG
jgi:hypothetical protein